MSDWILIACLKALFAEFDRIAPGRAHASDGAIGDTAHQHEVSDHNPDETGSVPIHDADHVNEVHAVDVDSDLNEPGLSMEIVVQFLLDRCRSGAERRLRYIIYNRRIWEASNGWRQRAYTGSSPHTEHAHFSASYDTAREADDSPWGLEDLVVSEDDINKIVSRVLAAPVTVGSETWELGTAVGYAARKAYLIDKQIPDGGVPTLEQITDAVRGVVTPAGGGSATL